MSWSTVKENANATSNNSLLNKVCKGKKIKNMSKFIKKQSFQIMSISYKQIVS